MWHKLLAALAGFAGLAAAHAADSRLENPQPGAIESGISGITGWYCPAAAITVQIDNAMPFSVPYGSQRLDTASNCGGVIATGFSYLFNYNTLTPGAHVVKAFADGALFASVNITVVTLGAEFLTGKAGEYILNNFPDYGKRSRVTWQQSKQNFVVTGTDTQVAPIDGDYLGGITVLNSGCTTAANNGTKADVDLFTVKFGAQSVLSIVAANAASSCTFAGIAYYTTFGGDIVVPAGDFGCTNGLKGTWASERLLFDATGMLASIALKYTAGETCSAAGHIGAARCAAPGC